MYLFYEKETEERAIVRLIYNVEPPAELLEQKEYIIADSIPAPEKRFGKKDILYCNPQTGELWYEYVDRELTTQEKIEELETALLELSMLIGGIE